MPELGCEGGGVRHSPFSGEVLVRPFDFCLTGTPAHAQGFIRVVIGGCSHKLLARNQQKDGEKDRARPGMMSADSPQRHRSPPSSANVNVS